MKDNWEVKMLYDGDCPLCMREVNMLRKRDKDQNKIGFVDISSQEYSPTDNAGITYEQVYLYLSHMGASLLSVITSAMIADPGASCRQWGLFMAYCQVTESSPMWMFSESYMR